MLAEFIKEQRIKLGLTQEYVSKELGMGRTTYIQIEMGNRDITVTEMKKLANLFGIPLEEFVQAETSIPEVVIEDTNTPTNTRRKLKIRVTKKNLDKFRQVLLYVLVKVGNKPNVGETVLHKLLYFIDFDYYEKYEETLMGATYIKNTHGPTSIELGKILDKMEKAKEIKPVKVQYFNYKQKKYIPLKHPDLSKLSAQEVAHIDDVLARLSNKSAKEIENYSHGDIPWKIAKQGEPLSYESVFYRDELHSVRNYEDEI